MSDRFVGVEVLAILLSKVDIQTRMGNVMNHHIVTIQSVTSVDGQIIVSVERVWNERSVFSRQSMIVTFTNIRIMFQKNS